MRRHDKVRTFWRLGLGNLARVALYRAAIKAKLHAVQRVEPLSVVGPFFESTVRPTLAGRTRVPHSHWDSEGLAIGHLHFPITDSPPDWFLNRITGATCHQVDKPWWQLSDFDPALGDIKGVWELSRMEWVLAFAQQARAGNQRSLDRLNLWLQDWCSKNPSYLGPNWKCGQEASIRVLHLLLAAEWLGVWTKPTDGLVNLIVNHLARISPTVSYAVGQCNNHATTEAAALYVGGGWLAQLGQRDAKRWQQQGRYWLENRARVLIESDGTFSQYSMNYHRLMLDAYSLAERFRQTTNDVPFSDGLQKKLTAAVLWLYNLTDAAHGDVPNLGANDGANLLPLTSADYRDYRPATELASRLWQKTSLYPECELAGEHCQWLDVARPVAEVPETACGNYAQVQAASGFAVARDSSWLVVLRYPKFRFRPSQADVLHLELWYRGMNLLRDAGSYSYNCPADVEREFISARGHNTIQFDDRDSMPRLDRFLYGRWPDSIPRRPQWTEANGRKTICVAYRDYQGAWHQREVTVGSNRVNVSDQVAGFKSQAVLRWRLIPGAYTLETDPDTRTVCCSGSWGTISVQSSIAIDHTQLKDGWESRYYGGKSSVPVLEITIREAGSLTSTISPRA